MKEINFYFPLSIVYDGDHNYVGNMFAAKHYQEEIVNYRQLKQSASRSTAPTS